MRKSTGIFAVIVLVLAFYAIKFSPHRIAWLVGLTTSIPIFAAIIGSRSDKD